MSTGDNCPKCRVDRHRIVGIVAHDLIQWWICENCGHRWVRWPKTHQFYPLAKSLMDEANNLETEISS